MAEPLSPQRRRPLPAAAALAELASVKCVMAEWYEATEGVGEGGRASLPAACCGCCWTDQGRAVGSETEGVTEAEGSGREEPRATSALDGREAEGPPPCLSSTRYWRTLAPSCRLKEALATASSLSCSSISCRCSVSACKKTNPGCKEDGQTRDRYNERA